MTDFSAKQARRECRSYIWPCAILYLLQDMGGFVVPTVASVLIGSMADSLLALDMAAVKGQLLPFLAALLMQTVVVQLLEMAGNITVVKRCYAYTAHLIARFLRRPLAQTEQIRPGAFVERVTTDIPGFFYNQIWKYTAPVCFSLYGLLMVVLLLRAKIEPVFVFAVLALSAVPVIRAKIIAPKRAKVDTLVREFEEERKREEYALFQSREFVHGFHLEGFFLDGLQQRFQAFLAGAHSARRRLNAEDAALEQLCQYGVPLGVLTIGALLLARGRLSAGELVAGYLLLPTITRFYKTAARQILERRAEPEKLERLKIFYGDEQERLSPENIPENGDASAAELRMEDIRFGYPGQTKPVLEHYSRTFSADAREILSGANGSGKTTILSLLCGLYEPQAGKITDAAGKTIPPEVRGRLITMQEQNGKLFSGTVAENLFLSPEQMEEGAAVLRGMGFEKPLDQAVLSNGSNLSPGERKKIILTRALLRNTAFLALDEPLNHLDAQGREFLKQYLDQRKTGLILVNHQKEGGQK